MCKNVLLKDIEDCRKEMIKLASHSSLSDKQVLDMSKKLDQLLNLYENHMKKN
ncbi:aspartyl-phosphate phosphatase Spo0E family protein [Cytobacillus dafuensis]|uniref:Aspartyl-phosphate phosphatase Spo0E family protein n=1 Tax=Cytobacillus dafuensis TaxID=1742359 RepID=A0A5B8Z179_CYTDA|nr:aspartyl-phosphate phosphatase Spo0E family protein [Cytobacillus dafuensis]QED45993.1 aspartyl-phosphate phosphatase Spo0E family protein [Cytobacillus dafuensis]